MPDGTYLESRGVHSTLGNLLLKKYSFPPKFYRRCGVSIYCTCLLEYSSPRRAKSSSASYKTFLPNNSLTWTLAVFVATGSAAGPLVSIEVRATSLTDPAVCGSEGDVTCLLRRRFFLQKYLTINIDSSPRAVERTAIGIVALRDRLGFDELPIVPVEGDLYALANMLPASLN
jgi:hypothetical protein